MSRSSVTASALPHRSVPSIQARDTVKTGADGSVGITFHDNSLLSAGPNSELVIERFVFDSTTHKGEFDTRAEEGHAGGGLRQDRQAVA